MEILNMHLSDALAKLGAAQVKEVEGREAQVMAGPVAEALRNFCRQNGAFARAVAQGGSFADCMAAVAKGVGQSISDVDAYKKAVGFYLPDASIRVQMTIDLGGETEKTVPAPAPKPALQLHKSDGPFVLNLDDFL